MQAIRSRADKVGEEPLKTTADKLKAFNQIYIGAAQSLIGLLSTYNPTEYDVGRIIAAVDELEHSRQILNQAFVLRQ